MKKLLLLAVTILLFIGGIIFVIPKVTNTQQDIEILFENAVIDAMDAKEKEIYELVCISKDDPMVTWDSQGQRVLLITWNTYPDSYIKNSEVTLSYGPVWTFTDKEIISWYEKNKAEMDDYQTRLNQLIGLRPEDSNTHFTAFWVSPEDIVRPAYITDSTSNQMNTTINAVEEEYKDWFEGNIIGSYYGEYDYPWTRLGYTYDWADNGTEYGLTEFLVKENAEVQVEYTMSTKQFIKYMDESMNN